MIICFPRNAWTGSSRAEIHLLKMTAIIVIYIAMMPGIAARYSRSAEGGVRHFLLSQANYSARDRPVLHSNQTIDVSLQVSYFAMLDLNEKDEVITTASWLIMEWRDEWLTWDPNDFDGVDLVVMYPDEIWIPKIIISDTVSSHTLGLIAPNRGSILVTSEGAVNLGAPMVQSTHCPITVRYFPFDTQVCPFQFIPENQLLQHMNITIKPTFADDTGLNTNEWNFVGTHIQTAEYPIYNYTQNRPVSYISIGRICVHIERDPSYFIWTLVIPSSMMCLLAFVTFMAPPDSGERISLGVSMVLGLTVFQLLVLDTLPTASKENPILSRFLDVNFILTCLTVPLSLGNINVAFGDTKLPLMKYAWFRRLMLEILPKAVHVPTYKERVHKQTIIEVKPQRAPSLISIVDDPAVIKTPKKSRIEPLRPITPVRPGEEFTEVEKAKLEARTVAVILDRVTYIILFLVFVCYSIYVIIQYHLNPGPGPLIDKCLLLS